MGFLVKAAPPMSIGSSKERRRNYNQHEEESSLLDTTDIDDLISKVLDEYEDDKKRGRQRTAKKKRSKKRQRKQYRKMKEEKCPHKDCDNKDSDSDSQSTIPLSENSDNENDTAFSGVSKMTDFSSRLSMFSKVSIVSKSTQLTTSSRLSRIMGKVGKAIPIGWKHRQGKISITTSASSIFDFGDDGEECKPERSQDGSEHTESTKTSDGSKQSDAIFQVASDGELDPIFVSGLDKDSFDEASAPPELRVNLTDAISSLIDSDDDDAGQGDIPDEPKEQEICQDIPHEPKENGLPSNQPEQVQGQQSDTPSKKPEPLQDLARLVQKYQEPKRRFVMQEECYTKKREPVNLFEPSVRRVEPESARAAISNELGMHRGRKIQLVKAKPNEQESLIEEIGEILQTAVSRDEDSIVEELIEDVGDCFGLWADVALGVLGNAVDVVGGALGDAVDVLGDIVDEF